VLGQRHAPAASTPGKDPIPIEQEAGLAPGPVWTGAENLAPTAFDPRTVQPLVSRYTNYATRPTKANVICVNISLNSSQNEKYFRQHIAEKIKTQFYIQ